MRETISEEYHTAQLPPLRRALPLLQRLLCSSGGRGAAGAEVQSECWASLVELALFTDALGVLGATQALLARGESPLFSSAGDRAEILQRTMLIRRPSANVAADLASHSAVHMVLAMCGTVVKVRQNDEVLVIEYAEQGVKCKLE